MSKKIEFTVVYDHELPNFVTQVNDMISAGYILAGSMCANWEHDKAYYYQPMMKSIKVQDE
jgi:hypothetical protein